MVSRFIFVMAVTSGVASGQGALGDWAMNSILSGTEPQIVLSTLNAPILNHPFSASAVVHLAHTLEDGTHINKNTTTTLYRDAQGRRRSESGNIIDIVDPVAGFGLRLDSDSKTAVKRQDQYIETSEPPVGGAQTTVSRNTKKGKSKSGGLPLDITTDDLGIKVVNGVTAHGVRTSTTIPTGAIGNDRAIKIVKEIWTSDDLRLPVKSIDSDPRFGTSTYDLTNIVLGQPDASLFSLQPPPGYASSQMQSMKGSVQMTYRPNVVAPQIQTKH